MILSGGTDHVMKLWDFNRLPRFRNFEELLPAIHRAQKQTPANGETTALLGRWYAFRGIWDWAIELLEKARTLGGPVSPLELARCRWERKEAEKGDLEAALKEFKLEISNHQARPIPADADKNRDGKPYERYLQICIRAIQNN